MFFKDPLLKAAYTVCAHCTYIQAVVSQGAPWLFLQSMLDVFVRGQAPSLCLLTLRAGKLDCHCLDLLLLILR